MMEQLSKKLRSLADGSLAFWCPGCNESHRIGVGEGAGPRWSFNGNAEAPTFSPSVLVRSGHFVPGRGQEPGACWCNYNAEHPDDPDPFTCTCCHSFVTDGRIQFLGDCTHALAGQTVELPDWRQP